MKVACFQNKVVVGGFKLADEVTVCARSVSNYIYTVHCVDRFFTISIGKGKKGPVEATGRVRVGDLLIAINGLYVHSLKYPIVVALLNRNQPYLYLRFLRIPACLEARRSGSITDELDRKKPFTSLKLYPTRSLYKGVYPYRLKEAVATTVGSNIEASSDAEPMDEEKGSTEEKKPETEKAKASQVYDIDRIQWAAEYVKDYAIVRIGQFDSEVAAAKAYDTAVKAALSDAPSKKENMLLNFNDDGSLAAHARPLYNIVSRERQYNKSVSEYDASAEVELIFHHLSIHPSIHLSTALYFLRPIQMY
jgi:hypothetical protein